MMSGRQDPQEDLDRARELLDAQDVDLVEAASDAHEHTQETGSTWWTGCATRGLLTTLVLLFLFFVVFTLLK